MRSGFIVLVLVLAFTSIIYGLRKSEWASPTSAHAANPMVGLAANLTAKPAPPEKVDFHTQVKPILESRCQGCHFPGGVMYQRLPFDQPQTIKTLGEKLFTRLKDEHDRRVIREFLTQ